MWRVLRATPYILTHTSYKQAIFLTGVAGLNQPTGGGAVLADVLRLNTNIDITAPADQSNMGVLGGDLAGYPNGHQGQGQGHTAHRLATALGTRLSVLLSQ